MNTIKFSHRYDKMPAGVEDKTNYLVGVSVCQIGELPILFADFDTKFGTGKYVLPTGKVMVLTIFTVDAYCWTTIRSWTPNKEAYYQNLIGNEVGIVVKL